MERCRKATTDGVMMVVGARTTAWIRHGSPCTMNRRPRSSPHLHFLVSHERKCSAHTRFQMSSIERKLFTFGFRFVLSGEFFKICVGFLLMKLLREGSVALLLCLVLPCQRANSCLSHIGNVKSYQHRPRDKLAIFPNA